MADSPDWREFLDPSHYDVPLHALKYTACRKLANYLDADAMVRDDFVPNFGGLAELISFDGLEIMAFERADSPTLKLIEDWRNRPDLKPTVGRLVEFLVRLGREDVLTDLRNLIDRDVLDFLNRPDRFNRIGPIQDETVTPGPGIEQTPVFITRQDVIEGRQTIYDAFVCYNPFGDSSKDLEFVQKMIARLEGPDYKFKLFVPHRDDLVGLNEHNINATIISERCRHMIVVLSPNFLKSEACEFQSTFAHALSPGARNKRIVPIKIEECEMPNILRIMACCDFTKKDLWVWSWDRLARSISIQLSSDDFQLTSSPSLDGLLRPNSFHLPGATPSPSPSQDSGFSSLPIFPSNSRSDSPVTARAELSAL
ncbi:myeloid differentiation primary response protein MyD88-like isoform X2 [Physella acuta]|uniref:myeloid differentiation primary response protein MyD88-like isoform X2 n=1 Tax=Physella acuta TaxID=109671 RepID=UPI0027DDE21A|nr:myeloid differentiation primary response protein MyD88-like isoform X2 [Physella acuta]